MKKTKFRFSVFTLLVMLFINQACDTGYLDKDIEDFDWDGEIAAPIGNIAYTVSELFDEIEAENLEIIENDDNIVTFIYREDLVSQSAADFIHISDQNFSGNIDPELGIPSGGSPTAETILVNEQFPFSFDMGNGEEIDSISFSAGTFRLTMSSTFADIDANFTVTVNSLKKKTDGSPLTTTTFINGMNPISIDANLADYTIDLTDDGSGGVSFNNFIMTANISVNVEIGDIANASDRFFFTIDLLNPEFESIYGDLKSQSLDIESQSIELDVFEDIGTGDLTFADPSLQFVLENSFGFPIGINFGNITASNASEALTLTGTVTESPQLVDAPSIAQVGQTITDNIVIDNTNSNIADLLSLKPTLFDIDVSAASNPGNLPAQNFILNTSQLNASLLVDLPLDVAFQDVIFEREIDNFDGNDFEDLENFKLNFTTTNVIPLSGAITVLFYDDNNNIVHTLTEKVVFEAAPIDENGISAGTSVNTDAFILSGQDIKDASSINLSVKLNTTNSNSGNPVKLLSTNTLEVQISAEANINF